MTQDNPKVEIPEECVISQENRDIASKVAGFTAGGFVAKRATALPLKNVALKHVNTFNMAVITDVIVEKAVNVIANAEEVRCAAVKREEQKAAEKRAAAIASHFEMQQQDKKRRDEAESKRRAEQDKKKKETDRQADAKRRDEQAKRDAQARSQHSILNQYAAKAINAPSLGRASKGSGGTSMSLTMPSLANRDYHAKSMLNTAVSRRIKARL